MKMRWLLLMVTATIIAPHPLSSWAGETEIPVLGIDENGTQFEERVSPTELADRLKATMTALQGAMASALANQGASSGWMLRTAVAGVGASAEVGVGPVLKLKAVPRFRMVFSNSKDPALP
jgi:hypothetical protein